MQNQQQELTQINTNSKYYTAWILCIRDNALQSNIEDDGQYVTSSEKDDEDELDNSDDEVVQGSAYKLQDQNTDTIQYYIIQTFAHRYHNPTGLYP